MAASAPWIPLPGGGELGGYDSSGVVVADRVIGKVPLHARFALLRKYRGYIHIIGNARDKLAYKKARNSGRSKP